MEEVIKTGYGDRGYKICECVECGSISRCTPHHDFYTIGNDMSKLYCESCFWSEIRKNNGE